MTLLHTPSQIIAKLLTEGSGALFTVWNAGQPWPIYEGSMPDGGVNVQDNAAAVYDPVGRIDAILQKTVVGGYGIQVKVRALDYQQGFVRIQAAADQMAEVLNQSVTLDSTTYRVNAVIQTSPAAGIGQDERRRNAFTANFLLYLLD